MKYFLGFLAVIALVILAFILVIRGFRSDVKPQDQLVLVDHAASSMTVQLTVDGQVTSDQTHDGYRITVDRNQSKIETYRGYQNDIIETKTYDNNDTAYATFLRALDLVGFAKGNDDASKADERGVCAEGRRFIYKIEDSPKGDKRYWSTSCGGGTFRGQAQKVRELFQRQIPEFSQVTSRLEL